MNTIGKITLVLGVALTIQVCTTSSKEEKNTQNLQSRKGNFKDFDVDFKTHEFDSKDPKTIKHFTGTTVQIPANAFIDAQGKPITGNVKVNYREFHQAAEIIASGITMEYDSAGKKRPFESAGMFDIRAEQAGKPVFLAKDKSIKVDLASHKEGAFNFYFLQEYKQEKTASVHFSAPFISHAVAQDIRPGEDKWQLLQTSGLPTENQERKAKLAEINKKLPTEPKAPAMYDEKAPVFDLNLDLKEFPELRTFEGVIWQYAGEAADNTKNPKQNEWIFDHQWDNIRLEDAGDMQYKMFFTSATKTFESIARPTLKGMNYEKAKALFEEKRKQYESEVAARKEEMEKLRIEKNYYSRQAKFFRSFNIQGLGIYNCDRIFNENEAVEIALDFTVPDDPSASKSKKAMVYMIFGQDIIQFSADNNKLSRALLTARFPNKMLVIFQESNKIATYNQTAFKKLGNVRKLRGKKIEIELESVKEPLKSTAELQELVATL